MKRIIALILAALMLVSFAACGSPSGNGGTVSTDQNDKDEQPGTGTTPSTQENKIDATKITDSTKFSEGKAWVRCGATFSDEYFANVYCINKKGEILFTLNTAADPSLFYNGLSIFKQGGVYYLCNENGQIIKASDIGATEILDLRSNILADGYIFVKKTETTFSESSEKVAILNADFEIVVDYSEELFDFYKKYIDSSSYSYYNGYMYSKNKSEVFDLKSGKLVENVDAFWATFEPVYASDMWEYKQETCAYYDTLTSIETLNLYQYKETISKMFLFENGLAPLVFSSAGKAFFAVIKEDGSFCFDPVELGGSASCQVYSCDGKYVLVWEKSDGYRFESFDQNGKVAEKDMKITKSVLTDWFKFGDDVWIARIKNQFYYFDYTLKELVR